MEQFKWYKITLGRFLMHLKILFKMFTLLLFSIAVLSTEIANADDDDISIWTRSPGQYGNEKDVKPGNKKTIAKNALKTSKQELLDVQYNKKLTFEAVRLMDIVNDYKPSDNTVDAMILHFTNKMAVVVPMSSDSATNLYVAFSTCNKGGKCEKSFPAVGKSDPLFEPDPRPINFKGNKLVSTIKQHPYVHKESNFTPWRHVDSLIGIEMIRESAYFAQFDSGGSEGADVYKRRCSYCHSAQYVGARFGWDFIEPVPVHTLKTPKTLFFHVKYPKAHALNAGLMMPNQKDINEKEANLIWNWMKTLATKSVDPYK